MTETWQVPGFAEVDVLGAGGFGRVVLAKHEASGQFVAIKYLRGELGSEPGVADGFRREAWLLRGVHSPHVVRLFEFVESPRGAALVMEAVPGVSLRALLAAEKTLAPESALAILKGSLLGLAAAHAAGVVHRDYKPGNVLVSREGKSKLVDFGLATLDGHSGLVAGSPSYMAPEQWAGRPGIPATDVYAATAVFFRCITGHRPFEADTTEQLRSLHERASVPLDAVPGKLRALIARGMAKDPAWRPASAEAFVAELEVVARAAYGKNWERRGWKRLATSVAALTALTPLALLATGGVAAAPVTAAGGAGTGVVAATVGKIVVAVLAVGALVAGGVWIYSRLGDAPRQAALSVTVQTATGQDSALPIMYSLQYPQVSGHADAAMQQRINDALRAPIDERLRSLRQELADPDILNMVRARGDVLKAHTTAKVLLQTAGLLSVRYDHTLDSDVLAHSSWQFPETVNLDLTTGQVTGPRDMFRSEILTAAGMDTLTARLSPHTRNGFCRTPEIGDYGGEQVSIDAADRPGGGDHVPAADIGFTATGVDFLLKWYDLGCDMATGQETLTLPYAEAEDLLRPQLLTMLGRQPPPSARPSGKMYTNARFGFSTIVPEDYAASPYEPANGDGMQYTNASLGATLTVWGANDARAAQEILSERAKETVAEGGQVTHQQADGTAYTISGYDADGQIFYERGYTGPASLAAIRWGYPRAHKADLDTPVETTVNAFHPGDLTRPH
ncbi:protein kinase domain-containing protein [Amycolatopsis pithecellobii]|uniref:non-specific serine/threonine protein kinase n=1 Tax=Amycolatopsis pithecellobii TaxID=664692 RepID=A0A6N7YRN5_9PSEU|nr:protein kinase [Amycolatopsis pithecellobii]MTD54578.1 protein kinase [Amycolatopsis pithecellobii]